ncbi:Uncharacterised protein [Mycobacterium tuberculosis]|nr:Uncharacterised protein [Mycobacterium tuberculosis]
MPAMIITGAPTAITAGRWKWVKASNPACCVMNAPIGAPHRLASRKCPTSAGVNT